MVTTRQKHVDYSYLDSDDSDETSASVPASEDENDAARTKHKPKAGEPVTDSWTRRLREKDT